MEINFGCIHYKRKCKIIAKCCNKEFSCRICHDEYFENIDNHKLNRYETEKVICLDCNQEQQISNNCINCNIKFGKYYCEICKLFDYNDKSQFHCDKCGICRRGGKENFYHCDICNACINIALKDNHKCIDNCFSINCPICFDNIFNSIKDITKLNCGHTIHVECFKKLLESNNFKCPFCYKTSIKSDILFNFLENEINNTPMPDEYNYNINILCNDCNKICETKFHILGNKCINCNSYNTKKI